MDSGSVYSDLRKVERARERIERAKPGKKAESEAEMETRLKKKLQIASGDLDSEGGQPSGASGDLTIAQVKKMAPEERASRSSEIAKLPLTLGSK